MTFLNTDYSKVERTSHDALPEGVYEMVIKKAQEQATPNGAESFQIDLVVRNDLDKALPETNGKYHNRHIFNDNWKRKATKQYDLDSFQYILEAVGVPEGTPINSIQDFSDVLKGKPVQVYVKRELDEYNTTDPNNPQYRNTVAPWNYEKTNFPQVQHQWKQSNDNNSNGGFEKKENAPTINDEDVPF